MVQWKTTPSMKGKRSYWRDPFPLPWEEGPSSCVKGLENCPFFARAHGRLWRETPPQLWRQVELFGVFSRSSSDKPFVEHAFFLDPWVLGLKPHDSDISSFFSSFFWISLLLQKAHHHSRSLPPLSSLRRVRAFVVLPLFEGNSWFCSSWRPWSEAWKYTTGWKKCAKHPFLALPYIIYVYIIRLIMCIYIYLQIMYHDEWWPSDLELRLGSCRNLHRWGSPPKKNERHPVSYLSKMNKINYSCFYLILIYVWCFIVWEKLTSILNLLILLEMCIWVSEIKLNHSLHLVAAWMTYFQSATSCTFIDTVDL